MLLGRAIATKNFIKPCFTFGNSPKVLAFGMYNQKMYRNLINKRMILFNSNMSNFFLNGTSSYSVFQFSKTSCTCQIFHKHERLFSLTSHVSSENDDDLRAILKDKSLGLTQKFKIVFRQYGVVMIIVHLLTAAVWVAIFYYIVSRGFDINPLFERWGVFDFLKKWGFSSADKLKNSGASDYVTTYVLYEIAKPIRYIVTLFGTMYAVRYLRRKGLIKQPPKSATVSDIMQTQSKIMKNRLRKTTKAYSEKYANRLRSNRRKKNQRNGFKNGISK